ncbi:MULTISPECIES: hypothetical protein [unclassified Micromonospora]
MSGARLWVALGVFLAVGACSGTNLIGWAFATAIGVGVLASGKPVRRYRR